jgi:hypothetical protein
MSANAASSSRALLARMGESSHQFVAWFNRAGEGGSPRGHVPSDPHHEVRQDLGETHSASQFPAILSELPGVEKGAYIRQAIR